MSVVNSDDRYSNIGIGIGCQYKYIGTYIGPTLTDQEQTEEVTETFRAAD